MRRVFFWAAVLCTGMPGVQTGYAQSFSEWNQATGVKTIEYRWKPNESKGCDVEYRNNKANDKKKYKARLVYQTNDEEKDVPNAVISFAAGTNSTTDQIPSCTMVTDISVTRF